MSLQTALVQRLTDELGKRGRSVNWLAGEIGMYQSTLSRQIANEAVTVETVIGAAKALRVDAGWLLTGGDNVEAVPLPEVERLQELLGEALSLVERLSGSTRPDANAQRMAREEAAASLPPPAEPETSSTAPPRKAAGGGPRT